jgi:hypothetical protein
MSYTRSFDKQQPVRQPPCMNLRSKAIYVTGNPDPQSPEEFGSTRFDCWCNKTQHVLGPDNELVDRTACVVGRVCYQPRG